ncbi:HAD family hydrolase [Saccharothrix syringae]|uniref:HAD family hydrolase n=1 Tax=Saccharothrix syringae TaxID=103733 RepID=A0A5Q0GU36_SACSY|nr:HAD hydrolase-like protein [Saccharothrix syringae]QFZ17469.1 HAD family hydrolase [Saccharothrix syringae]
MRIRAEHVVWDWNGTLLADNEAVLAAVNRVCREFGRDAVTLDLWRDTYSRPLKDCYEGLLARTLTADDWARIDLVFHEEYRAALHACGLAEGVPDRLRSLRQTQSLLSMHFHDELVPTVTELGLLDLFTRVDGLRAEVGGGSKAEHLAAHLDAQRLRPADVLVIGDVVDDADAARHVGAQVVLVATGVSSHRVLARTGVPVADSIPEALTYLV